MIATDQRVHDALSWLERRGSRRVRDAMLTRYGIVAPKAFGVQVGAIQQLAKHLGRDHRLAEALWRTGWYEARMLTAYVDEPEKVTSAQMDRWARDFDNWALPDTLCFALWDRTPHAWKKVTQWSRRKEEFVKRAAFAMLAGLALHDKTTGDRQFLTAFEVIERSSTDERNFVRKGVSWALRVVGRRNAALNTAAITLSRRLAQSASPTARWLGKEALRELASPMVQKRLAARRK